MELADAWMESTAKYLEGIEVQGTLQQMLYATMNDRMVQLVMSAAQAEWVLDVSCDDPSDWE